MIHLTKMVLGSINLNYEEFEHGDPLISPERQKQLKMVVEMLLYLVKHSRPDISNSVRELLKVAYGATEVFLKTLVRTVKYFIDTEEISLIDPTSIQQRWFLFGRNIRQ
jgi:hypothetical protein